jgi:hypothetical protein
VIRFTWKTFVGWEIMFYITATALILKSYSDRYNVNKVWHRKITIVHMLLIFMYDIRVNATYSMSNECISDVPGCDLKG